MLLLLKNVTDYELNDAFYEIIWNHTIRWSRILKIYALSVWFDLFVKQKFCHAQDTFRLLFIVMCQCHVLLQQQTILFDANNDTLKNASLNSCHTLSLQQMNFCASFFVVQHQIIQCRYFPFDICQQDNLLRLHIKHLLTIYGLVVLNAIPLE